MIKVENIYTCGWEAALRGMRNPMNSWRFSDSTFETNNVSIGPADLALMTSHNYAVRAKEQMNTSHPLFK